MALYNFHRVLISAMILFCFGFGLFAYRLFQNTGAKVDLGMAVGAAIVAVAGVVYLISFNLKLQRHVTNGQYH